MTGGVVDVLATPPDLSRWAFLQFGADYSAEHPIWSLHGLEDLESMRLPAALEVRLQRWSAYWDDRHDFDTGWPPGHPEAWWRDEQEALPRDLAATIGPDAVVTTVEGELLRSREPGTSPDAAAAMRALIAAGEAEDRELAELQRTGATVAANIRLRFPPAGRRGRV